MPRRIKQGGTKMPWKDKEKQSMTSDEAYKMKVGGLSEKQKKIAAKAPPPDKITGADFAVLKKEKAKGRGMGLQDESIKPGKVMKASMGEAVDYKKYLAGLKKATEEVKEEQKKNKFKKKYMGGGMAKKYSVGGGADMGDPKKPTAIPKGKDSEVMVHDMKGDRPLAAPKIRRRYFVGQKPLRARKIGATPGYLPKPALKMGGGMMNKPSGYRSGVMVKVKLGRNKPTKLY